MEAHRPLAQLESHLDGIRAAPTDVGTLTLIVRRPDVDLREAVAEGYLDLEDGLFGDNWRTRDADPDPERQLTLMGSRAVAAIAGDDRTRWGLAGDQLYVDLDLSVDNLPAGTRLEIGDSVVEVTEPPHLGCKKFSSRFGVDALRFVNAHDLRDLRLRGCNARVVEPGGIHVGDAVKVVRPSAERPL